MTKIDFKVYPNPAENSSNLCISINEDSKISAQLLDLQGKVIAQIIEPVRLQAGEYIYKIDSNNMIGTFLVKVSINENSNVKLLTLK